MATFQVGQQSQGMRDLIIDSVKAQRSADKAAGSISNKLLVLAVAFQEAKTIGKVSKDDSAGEGFVLACKGHEDFIRSSDAKRSQVDKLPRCWTQAKSNIKAAINLGLDLTKYSSESALRKDVAKARAAAKGTNAVDASFKALRKELDSLPEATAIDLMKQITALALQAIQELVPNEPIDLRAEIVITDAPVIADIKQVA